MTVSIGDHVRLLRAQPYLKTADPMPMLRPPDLVDLDDVGIVVSLHHADTVAVRFSRGTFLFAVDALSLVDNQESS
jgi:hypothetical protein